MLLSCPEAERKPKGRIIHSFGEIDLAMYRESDYVVNKVGKNSVHLHRPRYT